MANAEAYIELGGDVGTSVCARHSIQIGLTSTSIPLWGATYALRHHNASSKQAYHFSVQLLRIETAVAMESSPTLALLVE